MNEANNKTELSFSRYEVSNVYSSDFYFNVVEYVQVLWKVFLIMLTFLIALSKPVTAVPIQMTHQGFFDANGAAETSLHLLTFTLYDAETGGNSVDEILAVQFNNGYYATILGSNEQKQHVGL